MAVKKQQKLRQDLPTPAASTAKDEDAPNCFISYCWTNSHDAIAKGSRSVEGGLGWEGGDPRSVKKFLDEKGVRCWIDIEKVGGTGLFHSIADGLREAKIMVAFVSDEYVKSKNCIMEFRYALTTLRIPVIVVVVGTGYKWERSEVGLLVVGHACPKVNFQFTNETGYLELLKLVQEKLPDLGSSQSTTATEDNQKNVAFQEVLELTQRKFLRHMTKSVSSEESEPYPRLIVIDFVTDKEKQDRIAELRKQAQLIKKKSTVESVKGEKGEAGESCDLEAAMKADDEAVNKAEEDKSLMEIDVKSKYCFRLLCEYDQNWHESSTPIFFPDLEPGDEQQIIDSAAPYLGRVYAILKHGNTQMECLNTPEGEKLQQKIEEICMKSGSDFYQEYLQLRTQVMQQDKAMVKGRLQRCQVNGKTVWLCEEHKNASRSKTEQRYQDQFEQKSADIPIPTGELPENYVAPEPIEVKEEEEAAAPKQPHRKIFKRSSESVTKLQRQSSQMCSIS